MREVSRRVPRKRRDEGSILRRRGELPQSRGARQLPQGGSLKAFSSRRRLLRKQKETEGPLRSFCLRPHLRDSRRPEGCRLPLWCAEKPHFPKRRRDPILLPESFCVPLRRRALRGLSRNPSSDQYSVLSLGDLYIRPKKQGTNALDFVQIEYNTRALQSQAKAPERGGGLPQSRNARQLPQGGSRNASLFEGGGMARLMQAP